MRVQALLLVILVCLQTIKTNLVATEDESDEELDEGFEVRLDWNEDVEEATRFVSLSKKATDHTPSKPQEVRVILSDIARPRISMWCLGCRCATGIVDHQIGHNAKCRQWIMELMDLDKH